MFAASPRHRAVCRCVAPAPCCLLVRRPGTMPFVAASLQHRAVCRCVAPAPCCLLVRRPGTMPFVAASPLHRAVCRCVAPAPCRLSRRRPGTVPFVAARALFNLAMLIAVSLWKAPPGEAVFRATRALRSAGSVLRWARDHDVCRPPGGDVCSEAHGLVMRPTTGSTDVELAFSASAHAGGGGLFRGSHRPQVWCPGSVLHRYAAAA